jgi:RHS repeat-associated protein
MTGGPWSYVYDGNGLRVEKSNSATNGTLYWRSITGDAIAESNLSGTITNEYVFFAGRRIAQDASSGVYFYYADQTGSTTVMTNASGTPCYQATFTPYGEEQATQTTCQQNNYKFTGFERDAETGLDYAFARYYDSRLGRFLNPDPLGGDISNPQSLNRYAYVANDPANFVDPSGQKVYRALISAVGEGAFAALDYLVLWQTYGENGDWKLSPSSFNPYFDGLDTNAASTCTFYVRVNNIAGLSPPQLGRLESQINALLGPSMAVDFFGSGSPYYSLNITNAPPSDTNLGEGSSSFPATTYVNNINHAFGGESFNTVATIFGTVSAHELFHRITGAGEEQLDSSNPNNIMSIDALNAANPSLAYQLTAGNGLAFTPRDLKKLLQRCLANQQKK